MNDKQTGLPDPAAAQKMADEREVWATQARERQQFGSANEFILTAALLRHYAKTAGQ